MMHRRQLLNAALSRRQHFWWILCCRYLAKLTPPLILFSESSKVLLPKILVRRLPFTDTLFCLRCRIFKWRLVFFESYLLNCDELTFHNRKLSACSYHSLNSSISLTLLPHDPKSWTEFATITIPGQSRACTSTSSYSSVTVGRKNTSLPAGRNKYRANLTRSETNADNS